MRPTPWEFVKYSRPRRQFRSEKKMQSVQRVNGQIATRARVSADCKKGFDHDGAKGANQGTALILMTVVRKTYNAGAGMGGLSQRGIRETHRKTCRWPSKPSRSRAIKPKAVKAARVGDHPHRRREGSKAMKFIVWVSRCTRTSGMSSEKWRKL